MLTVKQIEAAKPKEKPYRLLDGNGLYLYVTGHYHRVGGMVFLSALLLQSA